jgi:hypothetical protein
MVEEVKALRASDGKLFTDELEAIEYEAKISLKRAIGETCTVEIMQKALEVYTALKPFVRYMRQNTAVAEELR